MSFPNKLFVTRSATDANAPETEGIAVTGTNTYYSKMWSGSNKALEGGYVLWTGTPTGTLTMQASNKPNPDETSDVDWTPLDSIVLTPQPAGSAGSTPLANSSPFSLFYRHRVKYVNASGNGVLTGWVHGGRSA